MTAVINNLSTVETQLEAIFANKSQTIREQFQALGQLKDQYPQEVGVLLFLAKPKGEHGGQGPFGGFPGGHQGGFPGGNQGGFGGNQGGFGGNQGGFPFGNQGGNQGGFPFGNPGNQGGFGGNQGGNQGGFGGNRGGRGF